MPPAYKYETKIVDDVLTGEDKREFVRVTTQLPRDVYVRLRTVCAHTNKHAHEIITAALEKALF